jgi:hypothetical protein
MSIEKDAKDYMTHKQTTFETYMRNEIWKLQRYMDDRLYASKELDKAKECMQESILWAEESIKNFGLR